MATTEITVTAFKTALAECGDAVAASNWTAAWSKLTLAEVIYAGLVLQSENSGASYKWRESLGDVRAALEQGQAKTVSGSDKRRLIKTRTSFG